MPPDGSFWRWDDQGAVIVWSNGSTIAFREELATILKRLAPKGLPAIDAVLLLIASTRAYWETDSSKLRQYLYQSSLTPLPGFSETTLFQSLDLVHRLPDRLTRPIDAKGDIAAIVFEAAPRCVSAEVATVVCNVLDQKLNYALSKLLRSGNARDQTTNSLLQDCWPLKRVLEGLTAESIDLWRRTGLWAVPKPASIDVPVELLSTRSFLLQLAYDDEFAGLSRLARNMAAVVQLPRTMTDTDELPIGGVSDITNRGTLDRLLLSELAHDDLMLATRLALNEALFLRRESPPAIPPKQRHLLIDCGLRMWGVPRVFSTAFGLSLAATTEKGASLIAYRASGDTVTPVDLATREGLVAHLEMLEPEVHPGRSLREFFQRVRTSESPGDVVVVTTDLVLADPEFQRQLSDADAPPLYLATVDREGHFQLWSRGPRGRKCHANLQLDLDVLFEAPQHPSKKLIDSEIDPNQPAFLRVKPCPFRFQLHGSDGLHNDVYWSIPLSQEADVDRERGIDQQENLADHDTVSDFAPKNLERGLFFLTKDHTLLLFDEFHRGALQIGENLPLGKYRYSWSSDESGLSYALIYCESEGVIYLFSIDLNKREVQADPLPSPILKIVRPRLNELSAVAKGSVVFLIHEEAIEVFDVTTKYMLKQMHCEMTYKGSNQRYYFNSAMCHSDAWNALSYDGLAIQLQHVPLGKYLSFSSQLALFDRRGHDGAFAIDPRGLIVNLTDQTERAFLDQPFSDLEVLDIENDGSRVLVRYSQPTNKKDHYRIVDTETCLTLQVGTFDSLARFDVICTDFGLVPMRSFTRAYVEDGQLCIVSNQQECWKFVIRNDELCLMQASGIQERNLLKAFTPLERSEYGYSLSMAKWSDGSRLWIDSRGLMHLQSSDRQIPEATIMLGMEEITVWTSDGKMLGSTYHVDGVWPSISAEQVFDLILTPFVARLRK